MIIRPVVKRALSVATVYVDEAITTVPWMLAALHQTLHKT